ncbi:MAG: pyrroloquinoline quinone-dependent dehydrogenase [Bryobacteraceae bacterium]
MMASHQTNRRNFIQAAAAASFLPGARAAVTDPSREWRHYGGDAGAGRYSPLDQINRRNVKNLKVAWVHSTEDAMQRPATTIECTPIVIDGVMYLTTAMLRVRALDAASGKVLWEFDPAGGSRRRSAAGVNRAAAYWQDPGDPKDKRIFVPVRDQVFCINATTGKLIPGFANEGALDLKKDLDADRPELSFRHTSPVVFYKDMLITGGGGGDAPDPQAPGHIRGYDARTGKRKWIFHTIPKPGEFGHDTWGGNSWKTAGGTNNWGGISVDEKRGWVIISTGSPAFDYYGGDRKGMNLFGNCVIVLDAMTGKRIWHYQVVHHDVWDYDLPCQPSLITMKQGGRTFDAVAQMTKMGLVFVFDRQTGKPVYGVEERPIGASDVPGEELWKTQPFPLKPPPLNRLNFDESQITNISKESQAAIAKTFAESRGGRIYTPPSKQGTIVHPGFRGGVLWGGCCHDPKLNRIFASSSETTNRIVLEEAAKDAGYPFKLTQRIRLFDPEGYPAIKPPWGYMTAIDLDKGDFAWRTVNGEYPELKKRGIPKTGTHADGGAIATAGELVFMAGTMDGMMRAFDSRSGEILWEHQLEAPGFATPCTYEVNGKQYVTIAAGGGKGFAKAGDQFVTFSL